MARIPDIIERMAPAQVETTPYVPSPQADTRTNLHALLTGTLIGTEAGRHLQILRHLSGGGFGDVWVGKLEHEPHTVVIKCARKFPGNDEQSALVRRRIHTEASILRELPLEGIPRLLDTGTFDDCPFLVLEHIQGKTWRQILDRIEPRRAPGEFLRRASELAVLLSQLHAHGIVHADVKPENILSGSSAGSDYPPRTWLLDFGLSFRLREGDELRADGITVGTRGYIDPCVIGRAHERTFSTDIYAFGSMLYEGYMGRPLFTKTEWSEAVMLRNEVEYGRLSEREFLCWYNHLLREKTELFSALSERQNDVEKLLTDILQPDTRYAPRPEAAAVAVRLWAIAETFGPENVTA